MVSLPALRNPAKTTVGIFLHDDLASLPSAAAAIPSWTKSFASGAFKLQDRVSGETGDRPGLSSLRVTAPEDRFKSLRSDLMDVCITLYKIQALRLV